MAKTMRMVDGIEVVPDYMWPTERDPKLPPFFLEEDARVEVRGNRNFRIAGTFRTGVPSLAAVPRGPLEIPNWFNWLSLSTAAGMAKTLNILHAEGLIDWFDKYPKILTAEKRQEILDRAEALKKQMDKTS